MNVIYDSFIIAYRDIIRSLRQSSQLYGSIVRPFIWLFLLGNGLRGSFAALPGGFNYTQYIFPGMIAMNVLFASIMAGTSIIWDREFGFLKEIMVAPVSRVSIALGKTLSGSITSMIQGLIVLAFFPFLHLHLSFIQILFTILAMFIMAFAICGVGVAIATRMTSFEGFGTINNFLVMPLFFLSGAMYPLTNAPQWLRYVAAIDPVTYGVNLLRGTLLGIHENYPLDIGVLVLFGSAVCALSVYLFISDKGNK